MKKLSLSLLLALGLTSIAAVAETGILEIKGMHCHSCESQVNKSICKNPEIMDWFESCEASIKDVKQEIGLLKFTLKKNIKWDADKASKIEGLIKKGGREILSTKIK